MTHEEFAQLKKSAGRKAYAFYGDNRLLQWSFRDSSMIQCAADGSWIAFFSPRNRQVPVIVR